MKPEELNNNDPDELMQPKNHWTTLIKQAKLKDLRKFMLEYAENNQDFRHQINIAFSKTVSKDNVNNISYYRNQIKEVIYKYENRGFIDYSNTSRAMHEVSKFEIMAENYFSKGNLNESFCIWAAIAMEASTAILIMDDSLGECGSSIYEAFEQIRNIFIESDSDLLKENIFIWLHQEVQNDDYIDFVADDRLEPLFLETATLLKHNDIAHQFIDAKILAVNKKEDGRLKKNHLQKYLVQKITFLQTENKTEEANKVIDTNLRLEEIRKIRIQQLIAKNKTDQAEQLIMEAIRIADQEHSRGMVKKWKDLLLELYKQKDDIIRATGILDHKG